MTSLWGQVQGSEKHNKLNKNIQLLNLKSLTLIPDYENMVQENLIIQGLNKTNDLEGRGVHSSNIESVKCTDNNL